jgi:hypothetical protein
MRKALLVLGIFALGVLTTVVLSRGVGSRRPGSSALTMFQDKELDGRIPRIELDEVPFDLAMEQVQKLTKRTIVVDKAAVASGHFDQNAPITIHGVDVPLGEILQRLVSRASPDGSIGYAIVDDWILISDQRTLARRPTVRTYDVSQLVEQRSILDDAPDNSAIPSAVTPSPTAEEVRGQNLVELIEVVVSPDSWKRAGGFADAWYFNGRLFVAQSWYGNQQVQRLLQLLAAPEMPPPSLRDEPWNAARQESILVGSIANQAMLVRKRIPRIDMDQLSFDAAIDALRRMSGVTIWIDRSELPKDATDDMAPISLHLSDASLSDALDALTLSKAHDVLLGYTLEDGIVLLTSRDDADRNELTLLYDVRDLLAFENAGQRDEAINALMDLLWNAIDPGGLNADTARQHKVHEIGGRLIVTDNWMAQQRVANMLNTLRKAGLKLAAPMRDLSRKVGSP